MKFNTLYSLLEYDHFLNLLALPGLEWVPQYIVVVSLTRIILKPDSLDEGKDQALRNGNIWQYGNETDCETHTPFPLSFESCY